MECNNLDDILLKNFSKYDDRGLDIVASERETLKSIYEQYNKWILDFDRKRVEEIFDEQS